MVLCVGCIEQVATFVLIPCSHKMYCLECVGKALENDLHKCPFCRTTIIQAVDLGSRNYITFRPGDDPPYQPSEESEEDTEDDENIENEIEEAKWELMDLLRSGFQFCTGSRKKK